MGCIFFGMVDFTPLLLEALMERADPLCKCWFFRIDEVGTRSFLFLATLVFLANLGMHEILLIHLKRHAMHSIADRSKDIFILHLFYVK